MNHRTCSLFAYGGTVAAALLGTALLAGTAHAEGPQGMPEPSFADAGSSRSRADVQAEVLSARLSSAGTEWAMQQGATVQPGSYSRAQAKADFIAHRDQVAAMTSEHGGGNPFGGATVHLPGPVYARGAARLSQ